MPFCPVCKEEYPQGVTICSTCNVALVEPVAEEKISVFALQKEDAAQKFIEYLQEQGVEGFYEYSMRENAFKIYVGKSDSKKATKLFTAFYVMEARRKRGEPVNSAPAPSTTVSAPTASSVSEDSENDVQASVSNEELSAAAPVAETITENTEETKKDEPFVYRPTRLKSYSSPIPVVSKLPDAETKVEEEQTEDDTETYDMVTPPVEEEPVASVSKSNEHTSGGLFKRLFGRKQTSSEQYVSHLTPLEEDTHRKGYSAPRPVHSNAYSAPIPVVSKLPTEDESNETNEVTETIETPPIAEDNAATEVSNLSSAELEPVESVASEEPVVTEDSNEPEEAIVLEEADVTEDAVTTEDVNKPEEVDISEDTSESEDAVAAEDISEPEEVAVSEDDITITPSDSVPEPEDNVSYDSDSDDSEEDDDLDAFADFIENFKKNPSAYADDVTSDADTVVEEILPDPSLYTRDTSDYESVSLRPTDIQDSKITVPVDYDIIEEVITDSTTLENDLTNGSSSFADPSKSKDNNFRQSSRAAKAYGSEVSDIDEDFHGFVPDYSTTDTPEESEEDAETSAYEEFKRRVKERKAEQDKNEAILNKERIRKANLEKDLGGGKKIVFEDTDELDSYAGFVPDYTPNSEEEDMSFYKPHTVSDYTKYKKGKKSIVPEGYVSPAKPCVSAMRLTNGDEVQRLFVEHVPASARRTISPSEVRSSNFILSMTGKQLTYLFNSWMLLNITQDTVAEFESPDATPEENFDAKIEGIKQLLIDTFGTMNESFLDNLVHKYFAKYLDD